MWLVMSQLRLDFFLLVTRVAVGSSVFAHR